MRYGGWKLLGDGVIGRGRGCGGAVTGFGHASIAVEGSRCAARVRFFSGLRGGQPKAGSARMCRSAVANASTWG
jgi:hypothetical protein